MSGMTRHEFGYFKIAFCNIFLRWLLTRSNPLLFSDTDHSPRDWEQSCMQEKLSIWKGKRLPPRVSPSRKFSTTVNVEKNSVHRNLYYTRRFDGRYMTDYSNWLLMYFFHLTSRFRLNYFWSDHLQRYGIPYCRPKTVTMWYWKIWESRTSSHVRLIEGFIIANCSFSKRSFQRSTLSAIVWYGLKSKSSEMNLFLDLLVLYLENSWQLVQIEEMVSWGGLWGWGGPWFRSSPRCNQ